MQSLRRPRRYAIGLLVLFLIVSGLMAFGRLVRWDEGLLHAVEGWRNPTLTDWMLGFTFLGNGLIEVPVGFLIAWLLWRLGSGAEAKRYLLAVVTGELFYLLLKASFHRARPTIIDRLGDAGWYSYPSGHTMLSPILWSFGFLLLAAVTGNRLVRGVLIMGAVLVPPLVGASRVYLGVHYPSDVLGGLLMGWAWVVWWWPRSPDGASMESTSAAPAIK